MRYKVRIVATARVFRDVIVEAPGPDAAHEVTPTVYGEIEPSAEWTIDPDYTLVESNERNVSLHHDQNALPLYLADAYGTVTGPIGQNGPTLRQAELARAFGKRYYQLKTGEEDLTWAEREDRIFAEAVANGASPEDMLVAWSHANLSGRGFQKILAECFGQKGEAEAEHGTAGRGSR
jgi:hypothetical protein